MTTGLVRTIPVTTVVANVLASFDGVVEQGDNNGEMVNWMQAPFYAKGKPWCGCAINRGGRSALGTLWPIPATVAAGVQAMHDWAKPRGLISEAPQAHAIVLFWFQNVQGGPRYAHCGYVIEVHPADAKGRVAITSWEGNTNKAGEREGKRFMKKTRVVGPKDVFLLWWLALSAPPTDPRPGVAP